MNLYNHTKIINQRALTRAKIERKYYPKGQSRTSSKKTLNHFWPNFFFMGVQMAKDFV